MQFHLKIANNGVFSIPLNYNYQVQSAIYTMLRQDEAYAAALHNVGYGENNAYRIFTFGALQGNYGIHNKQLHFDGEIGLEIRSASKAFAKVLKESVLQRGTIRLFNQTFDISSMQITDQYVDREEITILTDSPVIAKTTEENGKTIYYTPQDEQFEPLMQYNFQSKYRAFYGEDCAGELHVTPIGRHRKVVTRYKQIWITAYYGKFRLQGTPQALTFLYDTGLGAKSSQGFGMFDIIDD